MELRHYSSHENPRNKRKSQKAELICRISVHVIPRASKVSIEALGPGKYKIKIAAAPVEGAANKDLIHLLSEKLGVSQRNINIISGVRSRNKIVQIEGLTADEVIARLA